MTIPPVTQLLATFWVENDTRLMNLWLSGHGDLPWKTMNIGWNSANKLRMSRTRSGYFNSFSKSTPCWKKKRLD